MINVKGRILHCFTQVSSNHNRFAIQISGSCWIIFWIFKVLEQNMALWLSIKLCIWLHIIWLNCCFSLIRTVSRYVFCIISSLKQWWPPYFFLWICYTGPYLFTQEDWNKNHQSIFLYFTKFLGNTYIFLIFTTCFLYDICWINQYFRKLPYKMYNFIMTWSLLTDP